MSPEPRIGDREREAAATALGEHFAAGRITREEYDERAEVVWAARFNSDLVPVFADLPPVRGAAPRPSGTAPARQAPATGHPGRGGLRFPFVPVLLVVLGVALLADVGWPLFVLLGVLWWAGCFRWARRPSHHRGR